MHERLYAPGPVAVPLAVREALARPVEHHRTSAFRARYRRVRGQLAELMGVPGEDVMLVTGSGTSAFEAALASAVPAGERVLALRGGKFGDRWAGMARVLGYPLVTYDVAWGQTFEPAALAAWLAGQAPVAAVTVVHSETSTGVLHDVEAIARVVRGWAPEALMLVDAVTSLAAAPIAPQRWGIDALISGSQKGVMLPPGLGFVWLSARAWARAEDPAVRRAGYTLDLHRDRERQRAGDSGTTPATSLIAAAEVGLGLLLEYGSERRMRDLERRHRALLAAGEALGCTPFAVRPSPALAALATPAGVAAPDVVRALAALGLRIAGGQDQLKPMLLRPSVLGESDDHDVLIIAAALERAWHQLGQRAIPGSAVAAASRSLAAALSE